MSNGTTGNTGTTTTGSTVDPLIGKQTGQESSLSNWVGPYVTEMLGRGQALASTPYQSYGGPLTAGQSGLQQQAFSGIAGLTIPTSQMQAFTPTSFTSTYTTPEGKQAPLSQQYMSPYLQAALDPQLAEARRQAEISRMEQAGRLAKAGAYGGSRQAVMESELNRNLLDNLSNITGQGYQKAFESAQQQFNTEQDRQAAAAKAAQDYGLTALQRQADLGQVQRDIEQQGIAADYAQFKEERDYPYKQVQYMQSLLQGLPLSTTAYSYQQPNALSNAIGGAASLSDLYRTLFGD
jgi:cation transport regulator ChaB